MSKVEMTLPEGWFRADGTVSNRERRSQLDRFVADHPMVADQRRAIERIISDWDRRISGHGWFTGFVRIAPDHRGHSAQLVGEAEVAADVPLPVEVRLDAARRPPADRAGDSHVSDVEVAAWRGVRVDGRRLIPAEPERRPVEWFTSTVYVPLVAPSGPMALRLRFMSPDLAAVPVLRDEIGLVVAGLRPRFMQRYHQEPGGAAT